MMAPCDSMTRVICVGNRFVEGDDLGPRVHDMLVARGVPAGIDLVDGGMAGLGLLSLVEGRERVVFVDAVSGFGAPGEVVVLDRARAVAGASPGYGHQGGLHYLLAVLPEVLDGPLPSVTVVGAEAPFESATLDKVAAAALALARPEGVSS
jgi:hydrogenase maturation protease